MFSNNSEYFLNFGIFRIRLIDEREEMREEKVLGVCGVGALERGWGRQRDRE